ncbi:unnamed protein product, partial [Symbiodinium sp. CCMP2456]
LHEAVRLQAVLQDLTREQRAPEEPPQRRAPEAAAERLALHEAYLLQLLTENSRLRQRSQS